MLPHEQVIYSVISRHLGEIVSREVKETLAIDIAETLGLKQMAIQKVVPTNNLSDLNLKSDDMLPLVSVKERYGMVPKALSEGEEKNIKPVPTTPRPGPPKPQPGTK